MKKLERSRTDRVLAGVCGGLGRYLGVDSDIVRVAWILSLLAGGVGLIPYVVAAFLLPVAEGEPPRTVERLSRNIGLGLLALAGVVVLAQVGFPHLFPWGFPIWGWRFLIPLVLAAVGVLLVWPRTRQALGLSPEVRLHRSVTDRVVAGVAGGIAHQAGVDPNVVRLAFVVLAVLTTGLAVLLYVLLIVVVPEEAPAASPAASPPPTPPTPPAGPEEPSEGPGPDQAPGSSGR